LCCRTCPLAPATIDTVAGTGAAPMAAGVEAVVTVLEAAEVHSAAEDLGLVGGSVVLQEEAVAAQG
jgi:hypothetical protein